MTPPPLAGFVVLDASRMLPGAVLARTLLDLGARVIKVEAPGGGDPYRNAPPLRPGTDVGAAFAYFLAGAESVCLDLRTPADQAAARTLARHADVFVESFRPGTMAAWGLDAGRLMAANPTLVYLSLTGYGAAADPNLVGHDLNITAETGLAALMGDGTPRLPLSDIGGALLAASALLAALLGRAKTGRGCFVDQPLSLAAAPFGAWFQAETEAGGGGLSDAMLGGRTPAYRFYECSDGGRIALAALEPKFWEGFLALLGLPELAGLALDAGPEGHRAAGAVASVLATRPAAHWVERARALGLPVSPVAAAVTGPPPGPFIPSLGLRRDAPAPRLGEHTAPVLKEFGAREG